jgi:hypothetical protein
MNRLALHASTGTGLSLAELIEVASDAEFDSIGLRVAGALDTSDLSPNGIRRSELIEGIDKLLTTRVSALDVGRADLGGRDDLQRLQGAQDRVLDFAVRLGARWATAGCASTDGELDQVQREFAEFARRCAALNIIPLLVPSPGTAISDLRVSMDIAAMSAGGVVLNVHTDVDPDELDLLIIERSNSIGYVRLQGRELDAFAGDPDRTPAILATLPVHIPVAVGDDSAPHRLDQAALTSRARTWRLVVDRMLEHPRAREARLVRTRVDRPGD